MRRLNWGCGESARRRAGSTRTSRKLQGSSHATSCDGLPPDDDSIDYAVSIHALPMIAYPDLIPVLKELRRVLKPGGVLRLALPDLRRGMAAYERGDREYCLVPDEEMVSLGGKLVAQLIWFGYSRTLFVPAFAEELLHKAGFRQVTTLAYRTTVSAYPEIVELDNREDESLFVEACNSHRLDPCGPPATHSAAEGALPPRVQSAPRGPSGTQISFRDSLPP